MNEPPRWIPLTDLAVRCWIRDRRRTAALMGGSWRAANLGRRTHTRTGILQHAAELQGMYRPSVCVAMEESKS
jgi:hypothetical protein